MKRLRFGKYKDFEILLEQKIKRILVDDYQNDRVLRHFSTKELKKMKCEIIENFGCINASQRIHTHWMQRFGRHFSLESFIVSPYKIKKVVEDCLALELRGNVGEHQRETFKANYNELYKEFSRKFNISQDNKYSRLTWHRLTDKEKLRQRFIKLEGVTLE